MLSSILTFIKLILPRIPTQRDGDEAYLNKSVDVTDLEARMKKLECRNSGGFGLGSI